MTIDEKLQVARQLLSLLPPLMRVAVIAAASITSAAWLTALLRVLT